MSVEGEESLESLYERAPVGFFSTTLEGVIVKVNETFLEMTGYTREAVTGRPFEEFLDVGSQLFYQTRYVPVLRLKGEVREVALTIRCADTSALVVLANAVVHNAEGRTGVIRTAVFDATERRDYERELLLARRAAELSESRVRILQDASTAFGAADSEASLAVALGAAAQTAFDAPSAAVMLLDDAGALQLVAGDHPLQGAVPVVSQRPEARALASGEVVSIASAEDLRSAFPDIEALLLDRVESISVAPMLDGGAGVGVLICFFGRPREFDDDGKQLQLALARQAAQVLQRIRVQEELRRLALHDPLTGLATRTLLDEQLNRALAAVDRSGSSLALLYLDLDGFKAINDTMGHTVGDAVLLQFADRLRNVVRDSDTVARIGGDEFVILCENIDPPEVQGIASRAMWAAREPFPSVPAALPLSVSVGIACYVAGSGVSRTELLRRADSAMYESKRGGKNRVTMSSV